MSLQEMSQGKRTLIIKCLIRCDVFSVGKWGPLPPFLGIAFLRPLCPSWFCVGVCQWEALCMVWKAEWRSRHDSCCCRQRYGQDPWLICMSVVLVSSWVSRIVLLKNYFAWCCRLKSSVVTTWWVMKFTVASRQALESYLRDLRSRTFTTPSLPWLC